ncbi:hypothetical protein KOI35_26935 [Actinoplanes bogorensis]|uniref:Uncharacterized protein n=1 Tax=Paractinoplanes bogorensis TaxID=1610840 RepID=A0ABS5YUU4_9ACTN|nr:hypothetical protein [Actinoplanes bogorensis]MBU2667148.1 hypothetical protein [Actinoplanes bogorensis]
MTTPDSPLLVSLHPVAGLDDLEHSSVAWGTLIDPGLALLSTEESEPGTRSWPATLRLLAGPAQPGDSLLEASIARVLHLTVPGCRSYLVVEAGLEDWDLSRTRLWHPGTADDFDAPAAVLADQVLTRCTPPSPAWFDHAAKARTGFGKVPRPYPFTFGWLSDRAPEPDPGFSHNRRPKPTWVACLRRWLGQNR